MPACLSAGCALQSTGGRHSDQRDAGAATLSRHGPPVHLQDAPPVEGLSRPTRRCSRTSRSRSCPAPRSACSATTARASRRCCGSWPASTPSSAATRSSRPARPSACSSRSPSSTRARTCAATSRTASPRRARCSTASTSWPPTTPTRPPTSSPRSRRRSTPPTRWNLDTQRRVRDGRAAPAAGRRRRHHALRRRAPPRRAVPAAARARPTCCCSTSPPTTSTPSRSRWLERHLAEYKGTVVAVTHDRYFLDNVAGWILELDRGARHPLRGQLLELARAEAEAPGAGGEAPRRRASARSPPSSTGCARTPRAARPSRRRACRTTRRSSPRSATSSSTRSRSTSRPATRLGDVVVEAEDLRKGFGDKPADRGPQLLAAAAAASSASSAPTAPARRRCSG